MGWDDGWGWWGEIGGECVEVNSEKEEVGKYVVDWYGELMKMGVDGLGMDRCGEM